MEIEKELLEQIEKWSKKIEAERASAVIVDDSKEDLLNNMDAYISDSKHFLRKKDYIRSFESLIYAWGIYQTLMDLGIIKKRV